MTPEKLLEYCEQMAPAGEATTSMFNGAPVWPVVQAAMEYARMRATPGSLVYETLTDSRKLAREINEDVMANEDEIAQAIERRDATLRAEIQRLNAERDAWKEVARRTGICMSCALGSMEPCTDCLGTGWNNGDSPIERAQVAEKALRNARDNGLIYWEPNTERGAVAKAQMLARIDAVLSGEGAQAAEVASEQP